MKKGQNLDEHLKAKDLKKYKNCIVFERDIPFKTLNRKYAKKNFYTITVFKGPVRLHYNGNVLVTENNCLFFSNPNIPYKYDLLACDIKMQTCLLTGDFLGNFGFIKEYPIFGSDALPLMNLPENTLEEVMLLFQEIFEQVESESIYKNECILNKILSIIYIALKFIPNQVEAKGSHGSARIASMFTALLEDQFVDMSPRKKIDFRFPEDFSKHLLIHVNHLNHALKEITGKTTSRLIAERRFQEAAKLLQHTDWSISEIGWHLGFEELPHFINFFKKFVKTTPNNYRKASKELLTQ